MAHLINYLIKNWMRVVPPDCRKLSFFEEYMKKHHLKKTLLVFTISL